MTYLYRVRVEQVASTWVEVEVERRTSEAEIRDRARQVVREGEVSEWDYGLPVAVEIREGREGRIFDPEDYR